MLEQEQAQPARLAYDRPSPKLIGFLKKHYGLVEFVPQNNNFVVFNQYFSTPTVHFATNPPQDSKPKRAPAMVSEAEAKMEHAKVVAAPTGFMGSVVSKEMYEKIQMDGMLAKAKRQEEDTKADPAVETQGMKESAEESVPRRPAAITLHPPYAVEQKVLTTSAAYGSYYSSKLPHHPFQHK